jgi:hypothetical protein
MGGKPKLVLEQGPSSLGPLRKRLSARLSDLYVRYFDRASADNHALAVCGREPVAHKVDHLCNREAMRTHDRLGTAIAPGGKQFKRASAKVCRAARSYRDRSRHQASGAALILFLKKHNNILSFYFSRLSSNCFLLCYIQPGRNILLLKIDSSFQNQNKQK